MLAGVGPWSYRTAFAHWLSPSPSADPSAGRRSWPIRYGRIFGPLNLHGPTRADCSGVAPRAANRSARSQFHCGEARPTFWPKPIPRSRECAHAASTSASPAAGSTAVWRNCGPSAPGALTLYRPRLRPEPSFDVPRSPSPSRPDPRPARVPCMLRFVPMSAVRASVLAYAVGVVWPGPRGPRGALLIASSTGPWLATGGVAAARGSKVPLAGGGRARGGPGGARRSAR